MTDTLLSDLEKAQRDFENTPQIKETVRRRLRFEKKLPKQVEIQGFDCEVHGNAQLIILRDGFGRTQKFISACEEAGIFPGAVVFALPAGAEIEVWEEK